MKTDIFIKHNSKTEIKGRNVSTDDLNMGDMDILVSYDHVEIITCVTKLRRNYVVFTLCNSFAEKNQGVYAERISISKIMEQLPDNFIQVSQKEIINTAYITKRDKDHFFLDDKRVRVSRLFKNAVNMKLRELYDGV